MNDNNKYAESEKSPLGDLGAKCQKLVVFFLTLFICSRIRVFKVHVMHVLYRNLANLK